LLLKSVAEKGRTEQTRREDCFAFSASLRGGSHLAALSNITGGDEVRDDQRELGNCFGAIVFSPPLLLLLHKPGQLSRGLVTKEEKGHGLQSGTVSNQAGPM
jgi:hypothetical protein